MVGIPSYDFAVMSAITSTLATRGNLEYPKQKRVRDPKLLKSIKGKPCVICNAPGEAAHIQSRGAGGSDIESNLLCLCRSHHRLQHDHGFSWLCDNYPVIRKILKDKGWTFDYEFGERRLVRNVTD